MKGNQRALPDRSEYPALGWQLADARLHILENKTKRPQRQKRGLSETLNALWREPHPILRRRELSIDDASGIKLKLCAASGAVEERATRRVPETFGYPSRVRE
ncbi:hypothetical protein NMY22_g8469 [Coprinellus aureogranulatus]|nr:hypothetical protein NMY22_g8469 [Coprinellus aureogranulatus]